MRTGFKATSSERFGRNHTLSGKVGTYKLEHLGRAKTQIGQNWDMGTQSLLRSRLWTRRTRRPSEIERNGAAIVSMAATGNRAIR